MKFLEEKKGNVFLLEEVKSSKMNWGMEENVPIKMFRAQKDENLIKAMDAKKSVKKLKINWNLYLHMLIRLRVWQNNMQMTVMLLQAVML